MKFYYRCSGCLKKGEVGNLSNPDKDFFMEGWRTGKEGTRHQIIVCNKCGAIHDVYPSLVKSPLAIIFRIKIIPFITNGYYLLADIASDVEKNIDILNPREIVHYGYSLNDRVIGQMIDKGFFDESYKKSIVVSYKEFLQRFKPSSEVSGTHVKES